MAPEFTERRQLILKLVVQEFIATASAVSSDILVRKYGLRVSSATVRNELSVLEELGYLTHLHTSAGRVPTDAGYRFYVEHLMEPSALPPDEQRYIRHQFSQARGELDQWIQLGASVLARKTQNASVITPPQAYKSRFKHLELIAIHEATVLLVLVLNDGTVRQQSFTPTQHYQQAELRIVSLRINECCHDAPVERIEKLAKPTLNQPPAHLAELQQQVLDMVVRSMRQLEDQVNREIYSDGLIDMLSQPEFLPALLKEEDSTRAVERMRQMLQTLTNNNTLSTLILQALSSDNVLVVIGEEHDNDEMRDYSVVLTRYGMADEVIGVLGVIGPTRMPYSRSISTVSYISVVMSDIISDMFGGESRSPSSVA